MTGLGFVSHRHRLRHQHRCHQRLHRRRGERVAHTEIRALPKSAKLAALTHPLPHSDGLAAPQSQRRRMLRTARGLNISPQPKRASMAPWWASLAQKWAWQLKKSGVGKRESNPQPSAAAGYRSLSSHPNRPVAASAPAICAKTKPGTSTGRMPENVFVIERAAVTAGFANEVDAVNQYAATM